MHHHLTERRRELKRRRKRRKEKKKELRQLSMRSAASLVPQTGGLTSPVHKQPHQLDEAKLHVEVLDKFADGLPDDVKPRDLWDGIETAMKRRIIEAAKELKASHRYVGPGDWDGSLKKAIKIMANARLARGFEVFLKI